MILILKKIIINTLKIISPHFYNYLILLRTEKKLPENFFTYLKRLPNDSIAIDLGANIGLISQIMSKYVNQVHSFEPNIEAYSKLRRISQKNKKIKIYPFAAGIKNRISNLYQHKGSDKSKADLTQASSLLSSKPNLDKNLFYEVKEIDIAEFVKSLDKKVDLIKIDVEGYEVEIINHLLDKVDFSQIGFIFCETHSRNWDERKIPLDYLRDRIEKLGLTDKFDLNWH
tara:strand:- start:321 stop:1004 length:684 start_codon:yes stop_codon:yes gene_type:complete